MQMKVLLSILLFSVTATSASFKEAFSEGKYQGQLRVYNNFIDAESGSSDKYGTAFGGRVGFETSAEHLWGFSLGFGYYTANDLGTNRSDANERAPLTPTVDVDILGEAFLKWQGYKTSLTLGRQKVNTPFANPSDAFLIPVTFSGYSLESRIIPDLVINAHYLLRIKNRQAQDFQNVGQFTLGRLGGTAEDTSGTVILGLRYNKNNFKVAGWAYQFSEIMNLYWLEMDYVFKDTAYKPTISIHGGQQSEEGKELLGTIDSQLVGVKVGASLGKTVFSLGVDKVSDNRFLTPYNFFTDASFTNSLTTGFGNVDSGTGWKLTSKHWFHPKLWAKLSYSQFDFDSDTEFKEVNFDVKYSFKEDFDGLSIWFRFGQRSGDTLPTGFAEQKEYRTQLQYLF